MPARSLSIARGVSQRSRRKMFKNPVGGLPPILIPLFMFAAFAGALSALGDTEGFDYYDFTAFQFVFVFLMASMLAGAFSAFEIAGDFESGIGHRLMLAAPQRMAIVAGYVIFAVARFVLGAVVVWGVALLAGMPVEGGALDVAAFVAIGLLLSLAVTLYGAGIALRMQSLTAGTLILIPIFAVPLHHSRVRAARRARRLARDDRRPQPADTRDGGGARLPRRRPRQRWARVRDLRRAGGLVRAVRGARDGQGREGTRCRTPPWAPAPAQVGRAGRLTPAVTSLP